MEQPTKSWKIERICSKCGHTDEIFISKHEAAFELVDINDVLGSSCPYCSSTSFTIEKVIPDLDLELLTEWATNLELHLMEQDEELLLADGKYLEMILLILDTMNIPEYKRDVLLDALCIIVYDNTVKDNTRRDDKLKSRVIDELNKRQDMLKLADGWIMDYIKNVVYPQLTFDKPNAV